MLALRGAKSPEAAAKVRQAVIKLLEDSTLFGLTLLGAAVRVEESAGIRTMATNGRDIRYDPQWVLTKPLDAVEFDLLHELLHIFHNHVRRRGGRDPKRWNYAADIRVAHDGLAIMRVRYPSYQLEWDHPPAHAWAAALSVEQIYEQLEQDDKDKQSGKGGEGVPDAYEPDMNDEPETTEDENRFRQQLTQDLAQAQLAEETRSKKPIDATYGAAVTERLKEIQRCEVRWDVLLRGRLVGELGHEAATWLPPNRRWFPELALPSRRATTESELLLGIDISGSIKDEHLKMFRSCVLPAAKRAKTTTIATFDQAVREVHTSTRPTKLLNDLRFTTGAHSFTDASGVFEIADQRRPSAIVILTDGFIRLPDRAYPATHWLLTRDGMQPPWGRSYPLRQSW